jgi:hypothetical protein
MKRYIQFITEKKSQKCYMFLDIDGCLVDKSENKEDEYNSDFHKEAVDIINKLEDKFNLKIIISSSWRNDKSFKWIKNKFEKNGIKIFDTTPHEPKHKRSEQIKRWLDDNYKDGESFVIIDDEHPDIRKMFPNNFIHIDSKVGFTKDLYYEKAKQILRNNS